VPLPAGKVDQQSPNNAERLMVMLRRTDRTGLPVVRQRKALTLLNGLIFQMNNDIVIRFLDKANKLFETERDKMSKKNKLLSFFVFFGIGLFGCASPQTTHNTPHVFAQAKAVLRQTYQAEVKRSFLTHVPQNSQEAETTHSWRNISIKSAS
jgi:hypothetical protein